MVYAIGVLFEGQWVWATDPTSNQRMVLLQMEGPLGEVEEDSARVFIGSNVAKLNHALKLQNAGLTNVSLTFKQVGDGKVFDVKSIRDLEMEYGGGDHDKVYTYTNPTSVREVVPWIRLMTRVSKGKIGGAGDGLLKYKGAKVQTSQIS